MLPDKLSFEILTPHKEVFRSEAEHIRLPGSEGYFGVLPGHTPLLATLGIGEIRVEGDKETNYFATSGGVAEVLPGTVRVLAETSEGASAIDIERAEEAKKRAQERLDEGRKNWDLDRAQISLARAVNRLSVATKAK